MQATPTRANRNLVNLLVDVGIFIAALAALSPRLTGLAIHEWLSLALGAAIVAHLVLHWQWIVEVARRLFSSAKWSARLNYILNTLLFIAMTVVIFTGLMISESVVPLLGLTATHGGVYEQLHRISADAIVYLIGLHVALHWSWIVKMVRRFAVDPLTRRRRSADAAPQQLGKHQEA